MTLGVDTVGSEGSLLNTCKTFLLLCYDRDPIAIIGILIYTYNEAFSFHRAYICIMVLFHGLYAGLLLFLCLL